MTMIYNDDTIIHFGDHKGKRLGDISIKWLEGFIQWNSQTTLPSIHHGLVFEYAVMKIRKSKEKEVNLLDNAQTKIQ